MHLPMTYPEKVKGKILVCLRGDTARVEKGEQALLAGAAGMILCKAKLDGNELMNLLPIFTTTQLTYTDGQTLFAYVNSTKYIKLTCFDEARGHDQSTEFRPVKLLISRYELQQGLKSHHSCPALF